MALACPRCSTQNPDTNAFCQACGTPLASFIAQPAAPPMGPPPGLAPPVVGPPPSAPPPGAPPPPQYQSPYYAPATTSGTSNPPQTAQQNKDSLDKSLAAKSPDAHQCPNTKVTNGSLNGAAGIFWQMCFTLTSGSQSVQAAAPLFAGANADGSVVYRIVLVTLASNKDNFIAEAAPGLASIKWGLH